jgi:hypothetical protein
MRLLQKLRRATVIFFIALVLMHQKTLSGPVGDVTFNESLESDCVFDHIGINISSSTDNYFLNLRERAVFPGHDLIGRFQMSNETGDTLFFSETGAPLAKYITLEYYYPDETGKGVEVESGRQNQSGSPLYEIEKRSKYPWPENARPVGSIQIRYVENDGETLPVGAYSSAGKLNMLPPGGDILISSVCPSNELVRLKSGNVRFRWVFNNLDALKRDSIVTAMRYEGRVFSRIIKGKMENRLDSLYYWNFEAQRFNAMEKFAQSVEVCQRILELDSTSLDALEALSDVLWKMNRFEEAIPYAQRGAQIIGAFIAKAGAVADAMEAGYYLNIFESRIDKCQRREKWTWAK